MTKEILIFDLRNGTHLIIVPLTHLWQGIKLENLWFHGIVDDFGDIVVIDAE